MRPWKKFHGKAGGNRKRDRDTCMPDAFKFRIQTTLWSRYRYSHFTNEDTEAWRGEGGCPRSQSLNSSPGLLSFTLLLFLLHACFSKKKAMEAELRSWGWVVSCPLFTVIRNDNSTVFHGYQDEPISILLPKQIYFKVVSVISINVPQKWGIPSVNKIRTNFFTTTHLWIFSIFQMNLQGEDIVWY